MTNNDTPTPAIFDRMEDLGHGFGYLGARRVAKDEGKSTTEIDLMVIAAAVAAGFDQLSLLEWADSRPGRWFGEAAFNGVIHKAFLPC